MSYNGQRSYICFLVLQVTLILKKQILSFQFVLSVSNTTTYLMVMEKKTSLTENLE